MGKRQGDAAIGPELEVVFVVDVLKLPKAMYHRRHDIEPRSSKASEKRCRLDPR